MRLCEICGAVLEKNRTRLCGSAKCQSTYNANRQRVYRQNKKREHRNKMALQSDRKHIPISNPPVRYKGGKWRIADWIISHFPNHDSYVEPFCGGASVFFQKPPSAIETLNDLNRNIVIFFDMLRGEPEALIRSIELTPYSRDEWEQAHRPADNLPALEIARRFYIRSRMSFDSGEGKWKSGFRYMKNNRRGKTVTQEWNDVSMLWAAARRLKDAQIENDDALKVIERFDGPETLFYIDPPYLFDTRHSNEEYYAFEMSDDEHVQLALLLQDVQGMVILSGYDHPIYQELYQDWHFVEKSARTNGNHKATECLWINPAAHAINRLPLFEQLSTD